MKKKLIILTACGLLIAGGAFAQTKPLTERERAERKERVRQNLKEAGQSLGEAATEVGQAVKETAKKAGTAIGKGADKAAEAIETEADRLKAGLRSAKRDSSRTAKRDTL